MSLLAHDGPGYYRSTIGGSLVVTSTERLLGLRVIAIGSSGNVVVSMPYTSFAEPISVTTVMPFDWTPSFKITNSTLTFSSTTLEWFAEVGF
jgi:hypothetical protein